MRSHRTFALVVLLALLAATAHAQPMGGPISGGGTGAGGGAPTDADYLVKTADGTLSAERVCTDSATATWDFATAGQAKLTVVDVTCTGCLGATELAANSCAWGSEIANDLTCTGTQAVRRNAGNTAWECYTPSSGTIVGSTGAADDKLICSDGAGGSTVGACTVAEIDNIRIDGNTISTTDTNGNLPIVPNGTGKVGIGLASPYRKFSVDGQVSFGDGDQPSDVSSTALVAPLSTQITSYTLDGTTGWWSFILNAINGTTPSLLIGYKNGGGVVMATHGGTNFIWAGESSGNATKYMELSTSGTTAGTLVLNGFTRQSGRNCLTSDYTNATASMTNVTGLSTTLVAGAKYGFRLVARFDDSVTADGAVFDFDGGTATATGFGVNCQAVDTTGFVAGIISSDATALATDHSASDVTGAAKITCDGHFIVNTGGTFIPRASQEAHSTGTLTIKSGSCLYVDDATFN